MIGAARGTLETTVGLQEQLIEGSNPFVIVDHQMYEVISVVFRTSGVALVRLAPPFGPDWVLQVASCDYEVEMWEVEGQS